MRLLGDGLAHAGVVAGQHHHPLDPRRVQLVDDGRGLGPELVCHGQQAHPVAAVARQQHGLALGFQPVVHRQQIRRRVPGAFLDVAALAHTHEHAIHHAGHALAHVGGELLDLAQRQSPARGGLAHRPRERVFGARLDRRGGAQQLIFAVAVEDVNVGHGGLSGGQRAGFVERHRLDLGHLLQVDPALEDHAAPRPRRDRRQERRRHRDHQGARRRHHQQHHRPVEAVIERPTQRQPRDQHHQQRRADHAQGVILLEVVQKALGGGLAALGLFHHFDDARQRRILGELGDAHIQRALLVERPGEYLVADLLLDRHRLAGDRRLVDARPARDDLAIHRDTLAGPDQHDLADGELAHRDGLDRLAALDMGLFGVQREQRLDRAAAAPDGVVLQHVAQREQEQQDRAVAPFAHGGGAQRRQDHQEVDVELALFEAFQAGAHAKIAAGRIRDRPQRADDLPGPAGPLPDQTQDDGGQGDQNESRLDGLWTPPCGPAERWCVGCSALYRQ